MFSRDFTQSVTARNPRWAWLPGRWAAPVSVDAFGFTETGWCVLCVHLLEHNLQQRSCAAVPSARCWGFDRSDVCETLLGF